MTAVNTARFADVRAEAVRLQALMDLCVLDTAADYRVDRVVDLAASLYSVPIALVSLIDADRQWFKSRMGLAAAETPRCHAFCDWTIRSVEVTIVADATTDARFAQNPLVVGDPGIRFYAGTPLVVTGGHHVGTLCVIDTVPRDDLGPEDFGLLMKLAKLVVDEFELRRRQAELSTRALQLDQAFSTIQSRQGKRAS